MQEARNSIAVLMLVCFCSNTAAQEFKYKARIETVPQNGFYGISITPELSRYIKTDFSDLRIVDDKGYAVPFVIKSSIPLIKPDEYKVMKMIGNELSDSGRNSIVIENEDKVKISEFLLRIKNASVNRTIDLSGSEDKKHWFSIAEHINLEKKFITGDDSYIDNVVFPLSSYHYLRLAINNGKNDPLNIVSIGRYSDEGFQPVPLFVNNPPVKFVIKDSVGDGSYITVYNPGLFHVSHISIRLHGPKFFKREAYFFASDRMLADVIISSDTLVQLYVPAFRDSIWRIKIINGDNPPLEIKSVVTGQEIKKAIAYVEAGKNYVLQLTNDKAHSEQYDLQNFKDSVPFNVPELRMSEIQTTTNLNQLSDTSIFSKRWIWPVIILVLLILSFFTWRLASEIGKKNQ